MGLHFHILQNRPGLDDVNSNNTCTSENVTKVPIRGVIFDMDGTLTIPCIDFTAMRRDLRLTNGEDIVNTIKSYSPDKRMVADEIILRHEIRAMEEQQLQPGLHELMELLARHQVPRVIVTRNSRRGLEHFLDCSDLHNHIVAGITRDDDHLPTKPEAGVFDHCRQHFGEDVAPHNVLVVGDSEDDVMLGVNNGGIACWIAADTDPRTIARKAHLRKVAHVSVNTLHELREHLEKGLFISRPLVPGAPDCPEASHRST